MQSLDHVTLVVKDLEQLAAVLCRRLGDARSASAEPSRFRVLWFQAGPTLIHLIGEYRRRLARPGIRLPKQFRTTRSNHFAFLVDDVEAAYAFGLSNSD